jgi:outer membrane usher protein FimD/PapC
MKLKVLVSVISTLCSFGLYAAPGDKQANFDINLLKSRGFSPDVAEFFKSEKRFTKGANYVTVLVNGVKLGTTDAQFDAEGQLCVTPALLAFAHIGLPDSVASVVNDSQNDSPDNAQNKQAINCINLTQHYPQAIVKLQPGKDQIELIVPPEALRSPIVNNPAIGVTTGGTAAILNYDIVDSRSRYSGGNTHTLQAATEIGLNTHGWIVRSRQSYSNSNGVQRFNNLNAYAQKTLVEQKQVLQVGQINPASALLSVPTLTGLQIIPEGALLQSTSAGVSASGIAQNEARVEVHQKGKLIYSTLVPPGPFTLRQLPIIDSNADLSVKVTETGGGAEHTFIVSSSTFNVGFTQTAKSVSFAIGKQEQSGVPTSDGGTTGNNWLATVNASLPLTERANLTTGTVLTSHYQGAGFGISAAPTRSTSVNLSNVWSRQAHSGWVGTQLQLNGAAQLSPTLSLNGSLQQRTKKFRSVGDPSGPLVNDNGIAFTTGYKQQQTANLSYRWDKLGSLSLGYSAYTGFDKKSAKRLVAGWSKNIGKASLTLSGEYGGADKDQAFFLSLNLPLGGRSINTSTSRQGDRVQSRISVSEQVNGYVGYSASANTDYSNKPIGTSIGANFLPKYAQLNAGLSIRGSDSSSLNTGLSGGVVAHGSGVTFTPYRVQDTFAVVSVPGISGARINTSQGPVWTDFAGRAVASSMPAYSEGRLELVSKSLPRTADMKTGIRTVRMGRGAVTHVGFEIIQTRRALLRLLNENGNPIDKGTAIFDESGAWLTSIGSDGSLFLDDGQLKTALKATNAAGASCFFSYQFPDKIDPDALYETADVTCT